MEVVSLLLKASSGFFAWLERDRAEKTVEAHLMQKYGLPEPLYEDLNPGYRSVKTTYLGRDWVTAIKRTADAVLGLYAVDEYSCEMCADLGMLITIVKRHSYGCSHFELYHPLMRMHNSETHRSLLHCH
jgi:hypothetical protein